MANVRYKNMQAEGGTDRCLAVFLPDGSMIEPIREEGYVQCWECGRWWKPKYYYIGMDTYCGC